MVVGCGEREVLSRACCTALLRDTGEAGGKGSVTLGSHLAARLRRRRAALRARARVRGSQHAWAYSTGLEAPRGRRSAGGGAGAVCLRTTACRCGEVDGCGLWRARGIRIVIVAPRWRAGYWRSRWQGVRHPGSADVPGSAHFAARLRVLRCVALSGPREGQRFAARRWRLSRTGLAPPCEVGGPLWWSGGRVLEDDRPADAGRLMVVGCGEREVLES